MEHKDLGRAALKLGWGGLGGIEKGWDGAGWFSLTGTGSGWLKWCFIPK